MERPGKSEVCEGTAGYCLPVCRTCLPSFLRDLRGRCEHVGQKHKGRLGWRSRIALAFPCKLFLLLSQQTQNLHYSYLKLETSISSTIGPSLVEPIVQILVHATAGWYSYRYRMQPRLYRNLTSWSDSNLLQPGSTRS